MSVTNGKPQESMSVTMTIRAATSEDLPGIAARLRRGDVRDVWVTTGLDPLDGLRQAYAISDATWTICVSGEPCAVFGITESESIPTCGHPWLLSTPEMFHGTNARWFAREAQVWLSSWLEKYEKLTNMVGLRNQAHVRWLEWVGFEFTHLFSVGKYPMLGFAMEREES